MYGYKPVLQTCAHAARKSRTYRFCRDPCRAGPAAGSTIGSETGPTKCIVTLRSANKTRCARSDARRNGVPHTNRLTTRRRHARHRTILFYKHARTPRGNHGRINFFRDPCRAGPAAGSTAGSETGPTKRIVVLRSVNKTRCSRSESRRKTVRSFSRGDRKREPIGSRDARKRQPCVPVGAIAPAGGSHASMGH